MLLLWIFVVIYVTRMSMFLAVPYYLQPCDHLVGKVIFVFVFVVVVFLRFCYFSILCSGHVWYIVLDCILDS